MISATLYSQGTQNHGGPQRELEALYFEGTLQLDGKLDEGPWLKAPANSDFVQAEPYGGRPATEKTEVRVLYDDQNLYFGVRYLDSDPEGIVLSSRRRDFDFAQTDLFALAISPYNDSRSGFVFAITPEGAERDAQIDQNGLAVESSWDGIWYVRAALGVCKAYFFRDEEAGSTRRRHYTGHLKLPSGVYLCLD